MYSVSSLVVCKIAFCPDVSDILDTTGKKVSRKRRRRRTQAIAKRYAFHANAIMETLEQCVQSVKSIIKTLERSKSLALL